MRSWPSCGRGTVREQQSQAASGGSGSWRRFLTVGMVCKEAIGFMKQPRAFSVNRLQVAFLRSQHEADLPSGLEPR